MRRHVGWGAVLVTCAIALACTKVENTGTGGSTASSTGNAMSTSGMTSTSGSESSTSSGSAGICKFDDPNSTFDNCVFDP